MRLGRVQFTTSYVVDLDNARMVEDAKEAVLDDVQMAFNNRELNTYLEVVPAPDAEEADIPSFLLEEDE